MSKRNVGSTMSVLGAINNSMVRFYNKDGSFKLATFTFGDYDYKVNSDGVLYRKHCDSSMDDFEEVVPSWCKGGIYPEYCINNCYIKAYHLSLIASDDTIYDKYMEDSSLVINHMVTSSNNKIFNYGYYNSYRSVVKPMREFAFNPNFLEIVSRSDNLRHAKFVDDYNLYGVCVSASYINDLSGKLINIKECSSENIDIATKYNHDTVNDYLDKIGKSNLIIS